MVAKTHFSVDDLSSLLANYTSDNIQNSRAISSGTVQTNYLIETNRDKFVLKYYDNRSVDSVRFEADVIDYLQQHDFPCAAICKNSAGESVSIFRDHACILYNFVDGKQVDNYSAAQLKQVVQLAARLQTLTRDYRPTFWQSRWNYTPDLCLKLSQEHAKALNSEMADAKVRWYQEQVAALELPTVLPKGICHADYDPSNVLFNGDEITALLDFDDANYTYLNLDLAGLIDGFAWEYGQAFNPEAARQIAGYYTAIRSLSDTEQQHIFDVHKLQILIDGLWFFSRGDVNDFYEKDKIAHLDSIGRETYRHLILS